MVGGEKRQSIVNVLVKFDLGHSLGLGARPVNEHVSGLVRNSFEFQTEGDESKNDLIIEQRTSLANNIFHGCYYCRSTKQHPSCPRKLDHLDPQWR